MLIGLGMAVIWVGGGVAYIFLALHIGTMQYHLERALPRDLAKLVVGYCEYRLYRSKKLYCRGCGQDRMHDYIFVLAYRCIFCEMVRWVPRLPPLWARDLWADHRNVHGIVVWPPI
jgi:hypothetical protein